MCIFHTMTHCGTQTKPGMIQFSLFSEESSWEAWVWVVGCIVFVGWLAGWLFGWWFGIFYVSCKTVVTQLIRNSDAKGHLFILSREVVWHLAHGTWDLMELVLLCPNQA